MNSITEADATEPDINLNQGDDAYEPGIRHGPVGFGEIDFNNPATRSAVENLGLDFSPAPIGQRVSFSDSNGAFGEASPSYDAAADVRIGGGSIVEQRKSEPAPYVTGVQEVFATKHTSGPIRTSPEIESGSADSRPTSLGAPFGSSNPYQPIPQGLSQFAYSNAEREANASIGPDAVHASLDRPPSPQYARKPKRAITGMGRLFKSLSEEQHERGGQGDVTPFGGYEETKEGSGDGGGGGGGNGAFSI